MILESRPLHKKKKRLAKTRSRDSSRDSSQSVSGGLGGGDWAWWQSGWSGQHTLSCAPSSSHSTWPR